MPPISVQIVGYKLIEQQGEIDQSSVTIDVVSMLWSSRQNQETKHIWTQNFYNKWILHRHTSTQLHPRTTICKLFPNSHIICTIKYTLTSLNNMNIQCLLLNNDRIKQDINKRKSSNTWKLKKMLLNHIWAKEISR